MADAGTCDLVDGLAGVLPSQVICEMLGVPLSDQPMIEHWTDDVAGTVKPVIPDDALAVADKTIQEFHAYLRELAATRRADPKDDLISALIAAEDDDAALDENELVSFCVTLLGAGTETTTNLIGVGTLALLQNPDQLAKLQASPDLIGPAIEELLRFEPPVQMAFPRVATQDTVIGGEEIIENELVAILLGAANHDPAVFPEPRQLQIDRSQSKTQLSFGSGAHFCIGAALARVEGEIALRRLLVERFPGLELADAEAPPWRDAFTLRGVEHLTVTLR
jgi:cytochrome P450